MTLRRNFLNNDVSAPRGGIGFDRLNLTVDGTKRLNGFAKWEPSTSIPNLISSFKGIVDGVTYPKEGTSYAQIVNVNGTPVIDLAYSAQGVNPVGYAFPNDSVTGFGCISIFSIQKPAAAGANPEGAQTLLRARTRSTAKLLINARELDDGNIWAGVRRAADGVLSSTSLKPARKNGWAATLIIYDFDNDKLTIHDLIDNKSVSVVMVGESTKAIEHVESDVSVRLFDNYGAHEHKGQFADIALLQYQIEPADIAAMEVFAQGRLSQLGVY